MRRHPPVFVAFLLFSTIFLVFSVATAKSIPELTAEIKDNPDTAWEAYLERGKAYRGQGDLEKAIADLTRAIDLNPACDEAYLYRGIAYRNKGLFDEAISDFNHYLNFYPKKAEVYYDRGNAYAAKGMSNEAIADYTRAMELKPGYIDACSDRATAYYRQQKYDKAWEDVRKLQAMGGTYHPRLLKQLQEASKREN